MSIARKAALILIIVVVFEVFFLVVFFDLEKQSSTHRTRQAQSTELALSVGRLLGLTNDAQSVLRAYAIAGDPALLKAYRASIEQLPLALEDFQRLARTALDDEGREGAPGLSAVEDVSKATAAVIVHLQTENALLESGDRERVVEHLKSDASAGAMDDFRRIARSFQSKELAGQRREYTELVRLARRRRFDAAALFVTSIVVALGLSWFLQQQVRSSLEVVLQNMSRYAAGDALHARMQSGDEIGRVDRRFREMADQLDAARRQLESRNQELARMNVEKNHFMGMAAHDLRNPLFGALVSVEVLLRRGGLPERDQAMLRRTEASLKAMRNLVSDFLDVSLIESGELRLRRTRADVSAVARDCVEMAVLLAEPKEIALHFEPQGSVVATVDPEKVGQVITNFLTNAVKYSPPRSQIEVTVAGVDGSVRVSVRDEGSGIAADEIGQLFMPFSRTSTRPTAGESSTGLGLAICRKIVEGHGGRIWAESEVGKGSVFSFEIPSEPPLAAVSSGMTAG